jgi:hypothetical protein
VHPLGHFEFPSNKRIGYLVEFIVHQTIQTECFSEFKLNQIITDQLTWQLLLPIKIWYGHPTKNATIIKMVASKCQVPSIAIATKLSRDQGHLKKKKITWPQGEDFTMASHLRSTQPWLAKKLPETSSQESWLASGKPLYWRFYRWSYHSVPRADRP